jgi:tetratricopeptide (TPR) repeat protein
MGSSACDQVPVRSLRDRIVRRPALLLASAAAFLAGMVTPGRVSWIVSPAWAAEAAQTASVSEADLTYFYKAPSPERAARLVTYFDSLRAAEKEGTRPPLIGFFASVFQHYPADIDKIIPESISPQMSGLLAVALRLAGQQAKAQSRVATLKSKNDAAPDLASIPSSLDAVEAVGPNEFDLLWGASFASGDPRYCSKILARFAGTANVGDNADDLVRLARNRESGSDQQWIVEKRGRDNARELIIVATALWALRSNAQQHVFVRQVLQQYVAGHPSEPATKALVALDREYGYYQLAKLVSVTEAAPGKSSVTVNINYFTRVLEDLERHAGSYPPHFEFADDRQRAERDITTIAKMLDPLTDNFSKNPQMLLHLALLHAAGHNLDIPDSAPQAIADFDKLLSLTPEDPQANYRYGAFLAATMRKGEGIPLLEKAKRLGVPEADYWLGLSYQLVGDKAKAIASLETYTKHAPNDQQAAVLLQAIRDDKFEIKTGKPDGVP